MGTDYGLHFTLFFYSIANGILLGLIYDFFRISRMFFLKNKIIIFFEDLLFCLICAVTFILLFYNFSFGQMRAYAFVSGIGGFCAYYFTLGRFTRAVCERVYAFMSPKIKRLRCRIQALLYYVKKRIYTNYRSFSFARNAGKGFGLLKIGGKV
ncbi:MAG: hypothetical protein CVU97_04560 [Firmicutes bacterium HGW-Firmicutes-21]|nr:MAG: hypothetical protein CVU97_04560 [Firmicutes bacterium HGW-Firmicutes-21]